MQEAGRVGISIDQHNQRIIRLILIIVRIDTYLSQGLGPSFRDGSRFPRRAYQRVMDLSDDRDIMFLLVL